MVPAAETTFRIVRIESPEEASRWRAAFAVAYCEIFAGEPYFEKFTPDEAGRIFDRLTAAPGNITLVAATGDGEVAGFGIAVPLKAKPDVARELTGLVPPLHTYYLAELGVRPEYRHHGLGALLIRERILAIDRTKTTHVVLRVGEGQSGSKRLYQSMGFEDMGVYMEVPNLRTDGSVRTDRRMFMSRVLSQVDFQ